MSPTPIVICNECSHKYQLINGEWVDLEPDEPKCEHCQKWGDQKNIDSTL